MWTHSDTHLLVAKHQRQRTPLPTPQAGWERTSRPTANTERMMEQAPDVGPEAAPGLVLQEA